jgi:hypothetical protein
MDGIVLENQYCEGDWVLKSDLNDRPSNPFKFNAAALRTSSDFILMQAFNSPDKSLSWISSFETTDPAFWDQVC